MAAQTGNTIDVGDWLSSGQQQQQQQQRCGLFVAGDDAKALPLRSRAVSATVYAEHGFCEVTEQLAYVCNEDCTVRFVFPLPPRSAVYKFEATIGDRKVVTEVKRKAVAQEEYQTAVRQGHSAVHMQQQEGASLYSVEVGNLCAMEEALVSFSYVRMLASVAGAVEFEHQATWVPPYLKASDMDAAGNPTAAVAKANPVFAERVSYKLSYRIKVQSSRGFRSIESPSAITIAEESASVRVITLDEAVSDPSRDLTLLIELPPLTEDQSHTGQLLMQECERHGGKKRKTVALATFIPRLPKLTTASADGQGAPQEIVFVVDGSGSMGGSPIQQALEAALFFVKDLPTTGNIRFNTAMFGSGHRLMWPSSKPYTQDTQQEATKWLQANVNANWGGTEVLSVLQAIYDTPLPAGANGKTGSRQIIFLTDGGVSSCEEQGIFDLVQGKAGSAAARSAAALTSIYSLGIGHGVHRGLVEGVATKTGGIAQFVVDNEPIGRKAGVLKRCALAAQGGCLTRPRLVSRSCMIKAAPNVLPPRLFPDEPLHILAEVTKAEAGASLDLTGTVVGGDEGAFCVSLPLDKATRVPGDVFAVLHAMCSIGGLLGGTSALHCRSDGSALPSQPDARQVEDAVVVLAEEEGLVTPHTSAVGVLLQRDPVDPDSVRSVEVPLQVPAGRSLWGAAQQQQQQQQQQDYMSGIGGGAFGIPQAACYSMAACAPPSGATAQVFQRASKRKMKKSIGLVSAITSGFANLAGAAFGSKDNSLAVGCSAPPPPPAPAMAAACEALPSFGPPVPMPQKCMAEAAACASDRLALSDCSSGGTAQMECEEAVASPAARRQERAPMSGHGAALIHVQAPHEVLSLLNLKRTAQGNVTCCPEVLQALAGQAFQQQGTTTPSLPDLASGLLTSPSRPPALSSDDAWVTLLALAYLRKYLASEQSVWSGLEAKALEWLSGVWPAEVGRSVGSLVLAAIKLL